MTVTLCVTAVSRPFISIRSENKTAPRISRRRFHLVDASARHLVTASSSIVVVNDRAHTRSDRYAGDRVARCGTRATANDGADQHAATRKRLEPK
jgi:hypothetical protein